jgi:hypothetical protein
MSNVQAVEIVADVPFNYLDYDSEISAEDIAFLGASLLSPSIGLTYAYQCIGDIPNSHGGHTMMYRLTISGQEALAGPYLERLALILKCCSPHARLHTARARDLEFSPNEPWRNVVDAAELDRN